MTSTLRFTPFLSLLGSTVLLLSCVSNTISLVDDDGGGSSSEGSTTAVATSTTSTSTTTTGPMGSDSTTAVEPADDTFGEFIPQPDGGGDGFECDIWLQDCPEGEKCMPWANDGGSSWNATRCTPIAVDAGDADDPCTVEGSGTSGIDDCGLGLICWNVDPETNEGTCVPFCVGTPENLFCADPNRHCSMGGDGLIALCLPVCDPIAQDCGEGQACYPINQDWMCVPDASGDMGAYGDPCEFINVCDPGLVCMGSMQSVPPGQACEAALGCCTEVCSLSLGDAQCSGAAEGQICQPWYEPGEVPPGYEDVGVCMLP